MKTRQVKALARRAVGLSRNSHWTITRIEWCGHRPDSWLIRIENRHTTAFDPLWKREKWANVWPDGRTEKA